MTKTLDSAVAALPFIKIDQHGPSLLGARCGACGTVLLGAPRACGACGKRDQLLPEKLAERGKLYSYTIIHRSYPGIKTPFVAATVDLDGGGTLKGTLVDIEPDPNLLHFDMPIDVVFRDSGQRDPNGRAFLTYYFVPATGAKA